MATSHQKLALALSQARRQKGLTQDELSDKAGLAYSTLAKIERGAIQNPSVFTVAGLCQALGMTVEELLSLPVPTSVEKAQPEHKVSFFYCDVNGVMVRSYQNAFLSLAEDSETAVERIEHVFWHYDADICRGRTSVSELNTALAKVMGVKSVDWNQYYFEALEKVKPMHDLLRDLSKKMKVGLITNIFPGLVDGMLKQGLLPDIKYAAIIESTEVGALKPQPRIYEVAEQKAGVPAEEILFVDDTRANLITAEGMGWHVLWFDAYKPHESIKKVKAALAAGVTSFS